ncbi:MAG: acyltransferase family protein [Polyangiaceae bacterium]
MSFAPTGTRRDAFHVPSLDGIRACSFLLVFVAHAGLGAIVPGGFGVTVFFFLSGYLITTWLRIEHEKSKTVRFGFFYLRRALRILPSFYLVLALAAAAAYLGVVPNGVSPRALAAQALHLANYWIVAHGYGGQPAGTGVYWSLAVEEHFYLAFPLLFLTISRLTRTPLKRASVLLAICALVLAWRCALVLLLSSPPDRTYVASDTRIDSILFGCALALFGNPALDETRFSERTWKRVLLPAALLVLTATFVVRNGAWRETFRYTIQGIALGPLFIAAVRYPKWGVFRLLNLRFVSFLGVLSYPLYLVHHVVLEALTPSLGAGLECAIAAFAISFAIAWTIHEVVEKPSARLRRRLTSPKAKAPPREAVLAVQSLQVREP